MGRDLFADLITDIEERYLKYNDEATLKEFAEFLEKEIEYLKTSNYNRQWAKRVFLIYEKLDKDPKLLRAVKNSFELKGFLFIAESVIEVEDEMDDEEEKHNQLEDTAKQIDDKIQYLIENVSCEESWICQADEIDEFVNTAGDEVKALCKNLDRI